MPKFKLPEDFDVTDSEKLNKLIGAHVTETVEAAVEEAVDGLKSKNSELLDEVKDWKKQAREAEEMAHKKKKESATSADELRDLLKTTETNHITAMAEITGKLETAESRVERILIDRDLTDALIEAGVDDPIYLKAAKGMMRAGAKIEHGEDGEPYAMIGAKRLKDHVQEWADTEEATRFVSADRNSGGGAGGSGGKGGSGDNPFKKDTLNLTKQAAMQKENPELAARLKAEAGSAK